MGHFLLGNRMVTFERRLNVPRQLSPEFLLVDLVMSWVILRRIGTPFFLAFTKKAKEMDPRNLSPAVSLFGKCSTQKRFQEMVHHAARVGI